MGSVVLEVCLRDGEWERLGVLTECYGMSSTDVIRMLITDRAREVAPEVERSRRRAAAAERARAKRASKPPGGTPRAQSGR